MLLSDAPFRLRSVGDSALPREKSEFMINRPVILTLQEPESSYLYTVDVLEPVLNIAVALDARISTLPLTVKPLNNTT